MKMDAMMKMFCPWRGGNCIGEECIACAISEQVPEDCEGDPVIICLRAEDARLRR